MRRRLLVSLLALIGAALLAFALPLGVAVRSILVGRALEAVAAETQQVALFADERARSCGEVELWLAVASRSSTLSLALLSREGQLFASSGGRPPTVGPELVAAVEGEVGRSYRAGQLAVAVPLATSVCPVRLVLHATVPDGDLRASIRSAWSGLAAVGGLVLGLTVVAAVVLGRQLSRPFEALAGSARRLGDGDFTATAPRSGLPEADAIAAALDDTADRLGRAVGRGAAFTADASHQLRTPLTALRLHLEALGASGADPDAVTAALDEADRLERTVDELVTLTRLDAVERDLDVGALVADRVGAWQALAARAGRDVSVEVVPSPRVRVRPAAVGQALQVLLDNALQHGRGVVTVRVAPTLPDEHGEVGAVRVLVHDEGPGLPEGVTTSDGRPRDRGGGPVPVRGGRGLVLARSLVEGEGGRLDVTSDAGGTTASIVLPGRAPSS